MKRIQPLVTIVALVAAFGALGFAWYEWSLARRTAAELAAAERRYAALQARQAELAANNGSRGAARDGQPADRAVAQDRGPGGRRGMPPDFSSDPEIAPLMLKQRQRQVASRYAALFARLGLSAEQRTKLEQLLVDKQLSRFEAMGLARRQGLGPEEAMSLARESDSEADSAIKALLGDTAYSQLQTYDQTYAQRASVASLSSQLGYSGEALSSDQQEQLITVLSEHAVVDSSATNPGPPGTGWGPNSVFGVNDSAADVAEFFATKASSDAEVIAQVSGFLNASQVEAVKQMQEAETEQLRLTALRVDRFRKAQATSGN